MSFVSVAPEIVVAAATDLAGIGSAISAANARRGCADHRRAGRGCR